MAYFLAYCKPFSMTHRSTKLLLVNIMISGTMCLTELPAKLYQHLDVVDYSAAEAVQNKLFHFFNIEVCMCVNILWVRATEILKSKSVRSTNDVIDVIWTCVRQSQIVTKTNDSSFSSKSVSEIDFSNTRLWIGPKRIWVGKKAKTCLSKFDIKFLVFVCF